MSKKDTTKNVETKNVETPVTREDLIKQYRKLGADMKALREEHIIEKEKCIEAYKKAKAELQKQRFELLTQLHKPSEKAAETAADETELDAEVA